jgi:hypothetical protein
VVILNESETVLLKERVAMRVGLFRELIQHEGSHLCFIAGKLKVPRLRP